MAISIPVISIHPPRTGWDVNTQQKLRELEAFQSTHPARGGTLNSGRSTASTSISIHPPRTGWDGKEIDPAKLSGISIHPPRTGWDRIP